MDTVSVLAGIVVGVAFVVAGASKLAAGAEWPAQAAGMGAPTWSVPAVPWIELGVGAGLAVRVAPWVFAGAALAMLVVFSVLIARRLAAGEHPPCACFGAWSARPIGAGHLLRNAGLAVLTVLSVASEW